MSTDNTDRPAERVNLVREGNTVYRALIKVAGESREYADGNGIDRALAELINVRASQLNGCVACLNQHLPAAREAGVPELSSTCCRRGASRCFTTTASAPSSSSPK
ncbi:carboxymuconolactone decarboxylase family protein, partial [Acinetobacter baumannii]|nr:carboxymuconolactone decarboxylase family protein [Acinetobacter baumannii]